MPLTEQQQARLVDVIAENVPAIILGDTVREQRLVENFDLLRKTGPEDPLANRRFVVAGVVDRYNSADKSHVLAGALYRRLWRDDVFAAKIIPFVQDPRAGSAQQAAIALRANTMQSRQVREFLNENEPRICVVAAVVKVPAPEQVRLGTGFLVGPDLVLTAYHTLKDHISGGQQKDVGPLFAFFDHYDGDPITDPRSERISALKVDFHADWLQGCCEDMPKDGLFRKADETQLELLPKRLDFALVKLAEPIGLHTRKSSGGARRGWIDLGKAKNQLVPQDRIVIPQHPEGHPQRIDFGRFSEADDSDTRIRYSTETDDGTSGAPCFNQNFELVAMHNASFRPDMVKAVANQAIRLQHILGKLALPAVAPAQRMRVWSVSTEAKAPRVILGRTPILDWIELGAQEAPARRADRVYAAIAPDKGSGKTFSTEILVALRRGESEPIVVLGRGELVPASVSDFIAAIANQLRISQQDLSGMPPRPSGDLPAGSQDGDKLRKWASEDVPRWFNAVLRGHRERVIDRRKEAKDLVETMQDAGKEAPPEYIEMANKADPVLDTRNRWTIAWIALDRLLETHLSGEVRDLIAGLVGGNLSEESMPGELRRLRWLFLGYAPDFLAPGDVSAEKIEPMQIGSETMLAAVRSMASSFDRPFDETGGVAELLQANIQIWMNDNAKVADVAQRLSELQNYFSRLAPVYAKMLGLRQ